MKRLQRKKPDGEVRSISSPDPLAQQLTGAPLVTADLAKISEALEQLPCSGAAFPKDAWDNVINGIWAATKGSEQGFNLADEWSRAWMFYSAEDTRRRWDDCAAYPPAGLNENSLFDLVSKKQEREAKLVELAKLKKSDYEDRRRKEAKEMDWRVTVLDDEVERRREYESAPPPPPPPSLEELREGASAIIAEPNILNLFGKSISRNLAGEMKTAKLTYLAYTSRLFENPMNVVIKGESAIGKSHVRDRTLTYVPPEDVVAFTTMSEKALLYLPESLAHKILSMAEAAGSKDGDLRDYLMREIISTGRITYYVPVKDDDGNIVTERKEIAGPIMFVTTTTSARLHPEIETRLLSLETDDTQKQTRRVMSKVTRVMGGLEREAVDLEPWHAFQRFLAAGERRVAVPFAQALGDHPKLYDQAVRMRRDIAQIMNAIMANALLNREHRERDGEGQIIATIAEDYATAYELMADRLAQGAGTKLKQNDLNVLAVVEEIYIEKRMAPPDGGVTVHMLVQRLKLDQATINRRLSKLAVHGFVENLAPGKGRTGKYRVMREPTSVEVLPKPKELATFYASHPRADPPENGAKVQR